MKFPAAILENWGPFRFSLVQRGFVILAGLFICIPVVRYFSVPLDKTDEYEHRTLAEFPNLQTSPTPPGS
jgi:hypothetical protein